MSAANCTTLLLSAWSVTTTPYERFQINSSRAYAIETTEDRKLKSLLRTCGYAGKGRKKVR